MSYALALGVVGGVIGSFVPVIGTQIGFAVGAAIGGYIDTVTTKITNEGPRLVDKSIQTSDEGVSISILYGTTRYAGTVIWSTDLIEIPNHAHSGGKGSPQVTNNTYTYAASFLVLLGQGQIAGIRRIWANKQLIYSIGDDADAATLIASSSFAKSTTVLLGTDTQMPPALIEGYVGVGNCPGYRGRFGILFEMFDCSGQFGNHLPQIECEVVAAAASTVTYNNVCSLTDSDAGPAAFRGRSWITDRTIFLWRIQAAFAYNAIEVFKSVDGNEKTYLGPLVLPTSNTYGEPFPVNTRDQFVIETVEIAGDGHQQLRLMFPYTFDGTETGTLTRVYPVPQAFSGYASMGDPYRMAAYDQDGEAVAFGIRDANSRYFAERVTIFGSTIVEYVFRTPASTTGYPLLCALTMAAGNVFALIFDGTRMNLHVIRQTDGTLVSMYAGPVAPPSSGTDILDSLRTDGASIWCWMASGQYVVKWLADGAYQVLATNVKVQTDGGVTTAPLGGQQCFIGDDHMIMQGENALSVSSTHPIYRHQLVHWGAVHPADVLLASIVQAECDFRAVPCDVTSLAGIKVHGYLVTKQMASRSVIEFLASVYRFDAVEVAGVLVFVLRGAAPVRTLTLDDLGAHEYGADAPDPITIQRKQETDLPQSVTVNFTNKDNAYQPGNVTAHRLNTTSEQTVTLDVTALALTATEASKIADVSMMEAWVNRDAFKWATNYRHEDLVPTDVVLLNGGDAIYRVRITKRTDKGGLLEFEGVADDPFIVTSAATSNNGATPTLITVAPVTTLQVLDIPMLRDADNSLGPYAAVDSNAGWPGAVIQKSNDDVAFESVGQLSQKTIIGFTTTALGVPVVGNTFDGASTVMVNIGTDTLSSYSQTAVLAGNATPYLIGLEVVYACTATLVSTGVYTLSNFLRGLRGTERFKSTHASGERFVVLQTAGMRKLSNDVSDLNVPRYYRAITFGRDASSADEVTFGDTGQALAPFAPVDLHIDYSTSPITLSWHRRSRFSGRFLAPMQPTLGEAVEKYEVDVKDGTGALVTTLTAVLPSVAISSYVAGYTATVYQISAVVGRGQGTTITL